MPPATVTVHALQPPQWLQVRRFPFGASALSCRAPILRIEEIEARAWTLRTKPKDGALRTARGDLAHSL